MFREAAQVLLTLLRCISMKNALSVTEQDHLNFFRLYDSCLMDCAVLAWCKCFGSDREDLHWKKLFPGNAELETRIGEATNGDLNGLSKKLRNYRDTIVAHHDLAPAKRATVYPFLAPLQASGLALYSSLHRALLLHGYAAGLPHPHDISGDALQRIEANWADIASTARGATLKFSD